MILKAHKLIRQPFILLLFGILLIGQGCEKSNLFNKTRKLIQEAENLTYITENFPPYNYEESGVVSGVAPDLLLAMFEKMGIQLDQTDLTLMDWTEAYQKTLDEPGFALFSMVQNAERMDLFKWVGPIAPHKEVLIGKAGQGIKITVDSDMNNYTIGCILGYPSFSLLLARGVSPANILSYQNTGSLYDALMQGEIDCISYSEQANNLIIAGLGYDVLDFTIAYTLQVDQLFYAFNLSVSDELIGFLQETLDILTNDKEADGSSTLEKILNNYSVILHAEDHITNEQVIDLVNLTAGHIESDASVTFTKINNQEAPYKDPDNNALYSFAYNTDLTIVAHASNSSIVGVNFKGKPDAAGKLFRDEILSGALSTGTGWADYIYTKPDKSGLFQKTTYYKLTNGSDGKQYIVCAGRYK